MIVKVMETGKETNLANAIALDNSQYEVNHDDKPRYDAAIDIKESAMISQQPKPNMRDNVNDKKIVLESKQEAKQIPYKDFSPFRGEDTKMETTQKLGRRTHSNHFSILSLVELRIINPPEQILNKGENELFPYIL